MSARRPAELPENAIAVIGLAGRFPGAHDTDELWRNLRHGVESVRRLDAAELAALGVPPGLAADPAFVPAVALPAAMDELDAEFFGISHREAEVMDPQHRLFLECCWEALESAGCVPERFAGDIAVYGGATTSTYLVLNLAGNPRVAAVANPLQTIVGNAIDSLTTRVSWKLGLRGQSYAVQCACSTGLVAVHKACESLLSEQCDMALAGAVSINVGQRAGYLWQPDSILSPDGHCRPFDAAAQGTVFGGGVAVVVLRRLEEALSAGDPVHAVILGSAVNNDGAAKAGFSAPSVEGEARAITEALAVAGVGAESIGYVEAHGTGTALGDPIEVEALTRVFRASTWRRGFCALGAVKGNIGHLDVAAGMAGFIKAVLALEHGEVPPTLHFARPNPRIDLAASPFFVNREPWPWRRGEQPRRAGVSAFGFGGTNAHVILQEAPAAVRRAAARAASAGAVAANTADTADTAETADAADAAARPRLLLLSARSEAALDAATRRLAARLRRAPAPDLGDVAWTLHEGRRAFPWRRMAVCGSVEEAAGLLDGERGRLATACDTAAPRRRAVAFLLPGQGAQHAGMGREVYAAEPVFRAEVDRCAKLLAPHLGLDIRLLLTADPAAAPDGVLTATHLAQPALFVLELALARLWRSWGVEPQALLGHSLGELAAACLAGVLSLDDALRVVAARGRLMGELPPGGMLAVGLSQVELEARLAAPDLPAGLAVAAINEPRRVVASGPPAAIEELARRLAAEGVEARPLHTSHAFHSPAMEEAAAPLGEVLRRVRLTPPEIPFLSNVTGTWIRPQEAASPEYWMRQLLAPVRFADCLRGLAADPDRVLLEVGPGGALTAIATRALTQPAIASLPHPREQGGGEHRHLLAAAGRLWLAGQSLDAEALHGGGERRRVPLPTYPFERRRYWIEPPGALVGLPADLAAAAPEAPSYATVGPVVAAPGAAAAASLHPRPALATPFVAPRGELEEQVAAVWREVLGVAEVGAEDSFLDLGGDSLLATRLLARLRQELGVQVPVDRLFARPTVSAVAALVVETIAGDAARAGVDEVARLVAEIHGLSEAQLEEEMSSAACDSGDAAAPCGGASRR